MADPAVASRAASAEWFRCPSCEAFVYHKRLKRNLGVCPECNYHFRKTTNSDYSGRPAAEWAYTFPLTATLKLTSSVKRSPEE